MDDDGRPMMMPTYADAMPSLHAGRLPTPDNIRSLSNHQRCRIRILFASAMIATSSIPTMGDAYLPTSRRLRARRSTIPVFKVQKITSTPYGIHPAHVLYGRNSSAEDPSRRHVIDALSFRPVCLGDIHECYRIAAASCQDDKVVTFDSLRYMQQYAGEYFWCASLPADADGCKNEAIIGFINSFRCADVTEEFTSNHDPNGSILAIHSVIVDSKYQYQDIATAMMQNYLKQIVPLSTLIDTSGFQSVKLLARSDMLSCYVDMGFLVLRPSSIIQGKTTLYELEARQDILESMLPDDNSLAQPALYSISRSTSNPDEGIGGAVFANGREQRRTKLHAELSKLGIDGNELENHSERFGTAAIRTYNSFLLPKSAGALAVAESPTRPRVVANNISFLVREFKADQERWLRNVDQNRSEQPVAVTSGHGKHPITIILDNIRSAHNVGNILRLAEAAQIDSVRLCGMTPRPPHPKVLKTAMGAAEYVSFGDDREDTSSTINTVVDLKAKGIKVIGVETTENATSYWDSPFQNDDDDDADTSSSVAYVFGNELIGVDVQVLRECDGIICLPTYGAKNSLNVATCVGIIVWDRLRYLDQVKRK